MSNLFNHFSIPENPTLVLCNPDDSEIGVIANYRDLNTNICFSDISDISYTIDYINKPDNILINEVYEKHIERREIHIVGVGYFIISDVAEYENEDGKYKEIQAKSCEYELNNINMPYINGTYQLYKPDNFPDLKTPAEIVAQGDEYLNDNCLMYEIMRTIPSWTLINQMELSGDTTVDGSHDYSDLAKTFRTFESSDVTVYSFLRNDLSDSYQCFVKFDIENRTIKLIKYEDVFTELPIVVSDENFLNACSVKTTIDNYVNSLKVEGTSGVNISTHNPIGGTTIYNFEHDINTGLIDGELKEALQYWRDNMTKQGAYSGVCFNEVVYQINNENVIVSGIDSVQNWLKAQSKLTEYKVALLNAIGSGEQSEVDKLIGWSSENETVDISTSFLSGIGMDYKSLPFDSVDGNDIYDGPQKRIDYITQIASMSRIDGEEKPDTGSISNLFYDMQFEISNLLYIYVDTNNGVYHKYPIFTTQELEYKDMVAASKELISAQELKTRISSEIKNMTSTYNGFEAEYNALQTTQTEKGYAIAFDDTSGEWYYTTPEEGSDATEIENIVNQLNIVKKYLDFATRDKAFYEDIFGTEEDGAKDMTTCGLVNSLSEFISQVQYLNGFKNRFTEIYIDKIKNKTGGRIQEVDRENAAIWADKLYTKLTRYLKQQTYIDENIVITDSMSIDEKFQQEFDLYIKSVEMLAKISEPAYEVTVDAESFMFVEDLLEKIKSVETCEGINKILDISNALHIRLPNGDVPLFHLLKISTNYDEAGCELTFGNRLRLSDPAAVFSDLQKAASSAANIIASERINWGINEEKINALMIERAADIDTTARAMTNSVNDVTFGDFGLKCFAKDSQNNPTYGIWCANGVMMFMNENSSPKMAIGRIIRSDGTVDYGINGQSLIANSVDAGKLTAGAAAKGTNYIKNGSFEKTTLKTEGENTFEVPDGWVGGDFKSKDASSTTGAIEPIVGNKCGLLNIANFQPGYPVVDTNQQVSNTLSVGTYTFSCYYKYLKTQNTNNPADDTLQFFYSIMNEDGTTSGLNYLTGSKSTDTEIYDGWYRVSTKLVVDRPLKIKITARAVSSPSTDISQDNLKVVDGIYLDGMMLEKSEQLNEYSPHLSETFAKYTTIDDGGIIVYNGKIRMFDGNGLEAFCADKNGNLTLTGAINASSGNIGGWIIEPQSLTYGVDSDNNPKRICGMSTKEDEPAFWSGYDGIGDNIADKENTKFYITHDGSVIATSGEIAGWLVKKGSLHNGKTGMSSVGEYAFYAGADGHNSLDTPINPRFSVDNDGILRSFTTLNDTRYHIKIKGDAIEFTDSSGVVNSGICFATSGRDGIWSSIFGDGGGDKTSDLAVAGSNRIIFGTRPNKVWTPVCEVVYGSGVSIGSSTLYDTLCFRPASVGLTTKAYLGDSTKPWTGLWIKGVTGSARCFTPQTITYQSAAGIFHTRVVLAMDTFEEAAETGKNFIEWLKGLL